MTIGKSTKFKSVAYSSRLRRICLNYHFNIINIVRKCLNSIFSVRSNTAKFLSHLECF